MNFFRNSVTTRESVVKTIHLAMPRSQGYPIEKSSGNYYTHERVDLDAMYAKYPNPKKSFKDTIALDSVDYDYIEQDPFMVPYLHVDSRRDKRRKRIFTPTVLVCTPTGSMRLSRILMNRKTAGELEKIELEQQQRDAQNKRLQVRYVDGDPFNLTRANLTFSHAITKETASFSDFLRFFRGLSDEQREAIAKSNDPRLFPKELVNFFL